MFTLQTLWPHWGSFPHLSNKELNDCNLNISSQLTVYGFVMVNDLQNPWKERLLGHLGCRQESVLREEGLTVSLLLLHHHVPLHFTSHLWLYSLLQNWYRKDKEKKPSTIPFPRRNNCKRFLSIILQRTNLEFKSSTKKNHGKFLPTHIWYFSRVSVFC